jgi:hypothetical protein
VCVFVCLCVVCARVRSRHVRIQQGQWNGTRVSIRRLRTLAGAHGTVPLDRSAGSVVTKVDDDGFDVAAASATGLSVSTTTATGALTTSGVAGSAESDETLMFLAEAKVLQVSVCLCVLCVCACA